MGSLREYPPIPCTNLPGLRRRLLFAGVILAGILIWLGSGRVWAQGNDRPHYVPKLVFRIPFNVDANNPRLLEVRLFVSEDQGQNWQRVSSVPPEQGGFQFRAEHDGLYFFTVQTVDINNKPSPPNVQGMPPQIRVYVDTQNPLVSLRQAPARDGQVGVEWEIREENLDVNSLILEYHTAGSQEWIPLTVEGGRTGQRYWNPGVAGNVEARLRVRDLAKNLGEAQRVLVAGGGESGGDSRQLGGNYNDPDAGRSMPAGSSRAEPRYVNAKRLQFELRDQGRRPFGNFRRGIVGHARQPKLGQAPRGCISPATPECGREGRRPLRLHSGGPQRRRPERTSTAPEATCPRSGSRSISMSRWWLLWMRKWTRARIRES